MIICGIETSCDETAVALVRNKTEVLADVVWSQTQLHAKYGGVVPEIASRRHVEIINHVFLEALDKSNIKIREIDKIAVTYGPGLAGALLSGVSFAKGLAYASKKRLVPVNHMHGHIHANFLEHKDLEPPFICLVVSGGHTFIVDFIDYETIRTLGKTRDDAAGEAFDKVARAMGIGYPGGPAIDRLSQRGRENEYDFPKVSFADNIYDFSFSGPKTAVLNFLNRMKAKNDKFRIEDVCASIQKSICDILVEKTVLACKNSGYGKICLAGGVAANSYLRRELLLNGTEAGMTVYLPSLAYCTDNAAMIANRAFYIRDTKADYMDLNAVENLRIDTD